MPSTIIVGMTGAIFTLSIDELLHERDSLSGELAFMERHVAALAEEIECARLDRDRLRERCAAVAAVLDSADIPSTVSFQG